MGFIQFVIDFSEAYQRLSWEALKKSINGLVNKVYMNKLEITKIMNCLIILSIFIVGYILDNIDLHL